MDPRISSDGLFFRVMILGPLPFREGHGSVGIRSFIDDDFLGEEIIALG